MTARAESSIFWPGISPANSALRASCQHGSCIAPSSPSAPPTPLTNPDYPFQCICADFFPLKRLQLFNSGGPLLKLANCLKDLEMVHGVL